MVHILIPFHREQSRSMSLKVVVVVVVVVVGGGAHSKNLKIRLVVIKEGGAIVRYSKKK